jgi:arabinogalactan endo-1,4-beta-galactosidase
LIDYTIIILGGVSLSKVKVFQKAAMLLFGVVVLFFYSSMDASAANEFAKGADVSWVPGMEAQGYVWYDEDGNQKDILRILKDDYEINSIRLRVFVNPSEDYGSGWCDKERTVAMAKRAKALGFRIMIDFHYSDTWADPANQAKPAAWESYNFSQLKTAVYDHTYDVMSALAAEGIYPEWVQVGNETNNGMLWEDGKASASFSNFAQLINSGYSAVKTVSNSSKVIVHLSNGYDASLFSWMFTGLVNNGANFDVIGMSLYPTATSWASYNALAYSNMQSLVSTYGKEIMVCEIGMNYENSTPGADFIGDIIDKTKALSGNKGLGVFYWEPEAVPGYNDNYLLGAWNSDGTPTGALNGFLDSYVMKDTSASLTGTNLVVNPGFETDNAAVSSPAGWSKWASTTAQQSASYSEWEGYAGSYKLSHWSESAYKVSNYQSFTGLQNGTYILKACVMNSGGQNDCQLYAKNFGNSEINTDLPVTGTWVQVILSGIKVKNNKCEIGLYSDANAGNWVNLDNVEFFKVN